VRKSITRTFLISKWVRPESKLIGYSHADHNAIATQNKSATWTRIRQPRMTESSRLLRERRLSWELGRCLWHAAAYNLHKIVMSTHSCVVFVSGTCISIVTSFHVLHHRSKSHACLQLICAQSAAPSLNLIYSNTVTNTHILQMSQAIPSQRKRRHIQW
jgi:hypothetical protein